MPPLKKHFLILFGFVLLIVGAVFWLIRLHLIPAETWSYLWPSILIVLGLDFMVTGTHHEDPIAPMVELESSKTEDKHPKKRHR